MKIQTILLFLIIFLAGLLRFFYLDKIPNGLYSDEAAYGYNAYSILKTGKDEFGAFMPIAFQSFGDYKAPLYFYALVPFVAVFGLTEVAIRSLSAVLGILLVVLIHYLALWFFQRKSSALLAALLTAIMPFSLQFNRMVHENNIVVALITAAVLLFIISLRRPVLLIPSSICFALSMYAYHDARIFVPFFLLSLIPLYRKYFSTQKKYVVLASLIFIILLMPLLSLLNSDAMWSRAKNVNIVTDIGTTLPINEQRGEDTMLELPFNKVYHNKIIGIGERFIRNMLEQYSLLFLFFRGDPIQIYRTYDMGIIFIVLLPAYLIGLLFLFFKPDRRKAVVLSWFLCASLAAAMTRYVPSASRFFTALIPLVLIITLGLDQIRRSRQSRTWTLVLYICITAVLTLNFNFYLHQYYFHTPLKYAREWHYGMKEVITQMRTMEDRYPSVWLSKNAWGYIYPLFYLKYPPERYQPQAKLSKPDEYGFGWIEGFDTYSFGDFPPDFRVRKNTLFIGAPSDFAGIVTPIYTVYYPSGEPAFYFADSGSFAEYFKQQREKELLENNLSL